MASNKKKEVNFIYEKKCTYYTLVVKTFSEKTSILSIDLNKVTVRISQSIKNKMFWIFWIKLLWNMLCLVRKINAIYIIENRYAETIVVYYKIFWRILPMFNVYPSYRFCLYVRIVKKVKKNLPKKCIVNGVCACSIV